MKDVLEKALIEQRSLMRPEFAILNQNFVSSNEAILAEDERALQNAKIECICYLDPDSREMYFQSLTLGADDATAAEESSEIQDLPANVETDQRKRKKNAVDKMEQSFKFLKSPNDTFPRDESTKYHRSSAELNAPADLSHELKQSTSNFQSTMKSTAS